MILTESLRKEFTKMENAIGWILRSPKQACERVNKVNEGEGKEIPLAINQRPLREV